MGSVDLTLSFNLRGLPCEHRPFFIRFAKAQVTRAGKLWAIEDNTLLWAHAVIADYSSSVDSRTDTFEMDVSFDIPEGYWHKADKLKTYVLPWDICDFMECMNYHEVNPCREGDCCNCRHGEKPKETCECCDCGVDKYEALCYFHDHQRFYECGAAYRIVYDCAAAEKYFRDWLSDEHLGQKFCGTCGKPAAGLLYSDTDIPTDDIKITIHGKVTNPSITINDNMNIIKGEFNGVLEIHPDGSVYAAPEGCPCDVPLDTSAWVIPEGENYGWEVHQGNNSIIIENAACCDFCAYVEVGARTL